MPSKSGEPAAHNKLPIINRHVSDEIQELNEHKPGLSCKEIAEIFNVHVAYVRKVAQRRGLTFPDARIKSGKYRGSKKGKRNKTLREDSWEERLKESWYDRKKNRRAKREKSPHDYTASGRQGACAVGYLRLI